MSYEQTRNIFNAYLELYKIKYECHKLFGGYQWTFPEYPDADIICHKGSYYSDIGYVESFGFHWDNGNVTALPPEQMIKHFIGEK